jgi:hypothetical protein
MSGVAARVDERLDDGLRLAGCLLAAGDWPEREQSQKPYRPHRLAEAARRTLAGLRDHPAVAAAQRLEPAALFTHALAAAWPDSLREPVADFAARPEVDQFVAGCDAEWQAACADLATVLDRGDLAGFLSELFGGMPKLAVHPNLLYPGRLAIPIVGQGEIVLSQPPPPAWGSSPPWRYGERPDEVLAAIAEGLARPLFELALADEPAALALAAAVVFLRRTEGDDAADQLLLMEKKARQLPQLPSLVAALEAGQPFGGAAA